MKKNIFFSFLFKGIDCVAQLMLIPATIGYLNTYEYGIWVTLNSILLWINNFDIGLGNGLRNKLAFAIAKNDIKQAKSLVSTAFGMMAILSMIVLVLGCVIIYLINWHSVLGTTPDKVPNLLSVVYITFALLCVNFMMKFIGNVFLAMQMPSVNTFMVMCGHLIALMFIFLLTKFTNGSLIYVAAFFSAAPVLVYVIAYPITFFCVYPQLSPSIALFQKCLLKDLFGMGLSFFFLQISGVVLFSMSNILISNLFSPADVTPYNIALRYFNFINMLIAILLAPLWSAVTDAYAKDDYDWIKKSIRKINQMLSLSGVLLLVMVCVSNYVYDIWIGNQVEIPFKLSFFVACYVFIIVNSTAYSYILNGIGKLRIQIINTVAVALLFVPVCYLLASCYGVYGIIIGMILLNVSGAVLNRIQVLKLVNKTARGLWSK